MAERWRDASLNVLRIVTGFLFLCHGAQKLFGAFGGHSVPRVSLLGLAAVLEFFGGLAILFGLWTRLVAFILSGEMAVAYWTVHGRRAPLPIQNHGDAAVLFCFIFLLLWTRGGGDFSLDGLLRKRRQTRA